MAKFKNEQEGIAFCKASLKQNGTATLHLIDEQKNPEEGFIEISMSESQEHVSIWKGVTEKDIELAGYRKVTYDEMIGTLSRNGQQKAVEVLTDLQFNELIPKTNPIYVRNDRISFTSVGENRIVLIFLSKNWDDLSEYHSQYLKTTRH